MGCDIHYMLQKKIGEQWGRADYYLKGVDRHYMLFGFLAGVRDGTVYSMGEPNGLPDGYSLEKECLFHSKFRMRMLDGGISPERCTINLGDHSHCHRILSEIMAARSKVESRYLDYFFDAVDEFIKQYSENDGSDLRIVFGFDS